MALGHMLLNATESFITKDEDEEGGEGGEGGEAAAAGQPPPPLAKPGSREARLAHAELIARSSVAIMASALHNVGWWYTVDGLIVSGWELCSGDLKALPDGSEDGYSQNSIPCWVRNLAFVALGLLLQPNVLLVPLCAGDRSDDDDDDDNDDDPPLGALTMSEEGAAINKEPQPPQRRQKRRESSSGGGGRSNSMWARERARGAPTRISVISSTPMPSRRKRLVAKHILANQQAQQFARRNQVLAPAKTRSQSEAVRAGYRSMSIASQHRSQHACLRLRLRLCLCVHALSSARRRRRQPSRRRQGGGAGGGGGGPDEDDEDDGVGDGDGDDDGDGDGDGDADDDDGDERWPPCSAAQRATNARVRRMTVISCVAIL
jgi:hypothetical protein